MACIMAFAISAMDWGPPTSSKRPEAGSKVDFFERFARGIITGMSLSKRSSLRTMVTGRAVDTWRIDMPILFIMVMGLVDFDLRDTVGIRVHAGARRMMSRKAKQEDQ